MKRKAFILSFLTIIFSYTTFAQKDTVAHSFFIGIGIPSTIGDALINNISEEKKLYDFFDNKYGIGRESKINLNLMLKKSFDNNTIRLGFNYTNNTIKDEGNYYHAYFLSLGYERNIPMNNWAIFFGADICYWKVHEKNEFRIAETFPTVDKKSYGIGPLIGLAYSPIKNLKVETEIGAFLGPKYEYNLANFGGNTMEYEIVFHRLLSISFSYNLSTLF